MCYYLCQYVLLSLPICVIISANMCYYLCRYMLLRLFLNAINLRLTQINSLSNNIHVHLCRVASLKYKMAVIHHCELDFGHPRSYVAPIYGSHD